MAIIGLVLGIGLGAFTSLDLGDRAAVSEVQSLLRGANNWAVARQASARVRIDPVQGTLVAEGLHPVGTWQFEELPLSGAFDLGGATEGGELDAAGWQGKALSFLRGGPRARVVVPVQRDSAWDLSEGFSVRIRVRREAASGGQVLAIGDALRLEVDDGGRVIAEIRTTMIDELGIERDGGQNRLRTPPGVVPRGEWVELVVDYDRRNLRILADGMLAASLEQTAAVVDLQGSLEFGGGGRPFPGSIDSCLVSVVGAEDRVVLPEGVLLPPDSPKEVRFAPGGGLDRTLHSEPVPLRLLSVDGRERVIHVSLYGTVQQ